MRIVLTTTTGRKSFERVTSFYVVSGAHLYVTTSKQEGITRMETTNIINMVVEFTSEEKENGKVDSTRPKS